ncbi:MAG: ABC transporter ATP-binding protein [Aestuariivirga sp.]
MWRKVFSIYWNAPGGRPILVALLMFLATTSDFLSMGALVPLVAQVTADGGQNNSAIAVFVDRAFGWVGLTPTFTVLLIFVAIGLVLKSLIALGSMSFVGISVADVTTRIRTKLLSAMVQANWAYFTDHKPGEVATQISAQSTLAGQAYLSAASHITTVVSGLGLFLAAVLVSPKLMFFTVIAIGLLVWPLSAVLRLADRASKQQFQASNDLATGLEDVVNNMKPLKSMGRQQKFIAGFNDNIYAMRTSFIQAIISRHATFYGQDILATLLVITAVWFGVEYLHTPISQFFVFGVVFYQMIDVVKRIQQSLQDAISSSAGYLGVMETIQRGEAHAEVDEGKLLPHLTRALRLEDVSFGYSSKLVLTHASLEVPANKITVLVGQSGSGKTTMLDLIIGFNRPTKGRITIDGVDLNNISLKAWRNQIGYVPQELTLLRGTIADNIVLGDDKLTRDDIENALRLAGAFEFVSELPQGIDTDIGTMGAKLSGGQRQRISLARALVHKPKLLLLDEVTSALDEVTEAEICKNVKALSGSLTILAITHRPAWRKIAGRIYKITGGKAVLEHRVSK